MILRLAPSLSRTFTTAARRTPSSLYTKVSQNSRATTSTPSDLTDTEREVLEGALRVDQAGEIAANYIYMGQKAVLGRDKELGELIQDMWDQEKKHLLVMDKLQVQHNVRPTALSEVAKVAGFALGAVTGLMGKEAAMACTEAVETVIGEHYDDQLKDLATFSSNHESLPLLQDVIQEFRDDELEHLDIAVDNFSHQAPAHALLSSLVGAGCKVAIEVCKRI
ncbi:COQ7 protein [Crepidotus variabilis]|uniref:5-demethoxyubiquinone hydroxylase, mitochondrial n=1 Tax=Crepidotus variabilis TaxID=179855 RepID=A0A9P6JV02_9AGAR|nr:COQ7 protein [Crepidotus variabilis]